MKELLNKTGIKTLFKRGCLALSGILFLLFLYHYNQIDKVKLYETEGRSFAKAKVIEIISDNQKVSGTYIGDQKVKLKILSGEWKEKTMEANCSSSYLFGTHCTVGKKVIALINESNGEYVASVYSADREWPIYSIIILFVLALAFIGGKQGIYSVFGLAFTVICILWLFLPMIYRGYSPILSAILVVALTTVATMYLVGGITFKTIAAIIGTIGGVLISSLFALFFSKISEITGYNVSDIEDLIYIQEQTQIDIGQLLFAGILIAALGAVMDVAMSVSSTIEEISRQNNALNGKELFLSGMRVGRDMMGTMSNTLILAFAGGSINTLVFIYAYNYQYLQVINMYSVGVELIQGIASSMGVIMTVPLSAAISAFGITHHKMRK